jgi:5'-nucleotidase
MFLGGLPKGIFLREFEPDFFFDDQTGHIENAAVHVPAGHVAAGTRNEAPEAASDAAAPATAAIRAAPG